MFSDDKRYVAASPRPELRIIEPDPLSRESFIEVSRDALSIRGYQSYRCNDYSLGRKKELFEHIFHILSKHEFS